MARAGYSKERAAFDIVWAEEVAAGRHPKKLSKTQERLEGCDILSYEATDHDGEPVRLEIKGWGAPFRKAETFTSPADVKSSNTSGRATTPPGASRSSRTLTRPLPEGQQSV